VGVEVAAVRFGCQRVVVELAAPALGHDAFALAFENRDGRVGAAVEQAGWFDKLSAAQRAALLAAARGVLDMAAVQLVGDRDRGDEQGSDGAYAELLRPYTWAEWVTRWEHANPGT
jgi:hypothetical protein